MNAKIDIDIEFLNRINLEEVREIARTYNNDQIRNDKVKYIWIKNKQKLCNSLAKKVGSFDLSKLKKDTLKNIAKKINFVK